MKRPTQSDVARIAGVSRATVSYVLNNQTDQRIPISIETRQRVLEVIEQLGYEVDARAQSLRSGETKTIGVLLPIYENPYFWQILMGIASEAESVGYSLLLAHNSLTPEREYQSIRELAEQRVDGMILLIGFHEFSEIALNQIRKSLRPIVEISASASEFDHVHQSYGEGAIALMRHLISLGHQRIGFVCGVTVMSQGVDRITAYRQALEESNLPYDETLIHPCGELLEDGYRAAIELLSRPDRPTAVLAINDLLGIATLRAATDLGLRIPQDVSIASFDNIPFAQYTIPRLTTIASSPEENGRDAVRLLLKRLVDPKRPQEVVTSNWRLLIQESTGIAPLIGE